MLMLIQLLVIAQIHQSKQDQETMLNLIKKAFHWLESQSNLSAPTYTCESALLMGF